MSDYAALASRIRTSLWDIEKSVNRSLELSRKARTTGDDGYWDGVALNLHSFYTGIEHIWRISRGPLKRVCHLVQAGMPAC